MRRIRFLLCILLALCVLLPALPAAWAEEPEEDARFAGKSWDEVVAEYLETWGADPETVGLGYYNTVTGEEHYLNPDRYRVTASMYKVPLNMVFLDRLTNGEIDWDTRFSGYRYEDALEQTIVWSNNDIAVNMVRFTLGNGSWQEGRRFLAPYCGLDPETVDYKFLENNYSTPRQMIACLRMLYENPDRFPRLIEAMQRAEPTEYFKRREQRFDIAHKYGFLQTEYHLYLNDCGICFTDDPILLVIYTDNAVHAYDLLTEYCTLMCDYTQYHTAIRLQEEAEAEAEAQRQREEEERQAQLAEEAAREAREQAENAEQEGQIIQGEPGALSGTDRTSEQEGKEANVLRLVRQAEEGGISRRSMTAMIAAVLLTLVVLIVLASLAKRFRVKAWLPVLLALLLLLATLGALARPAFEKWQNKPEGDPQATVTAFLDALERQDYPAAYALLDGVETLGLEWQPEDETLALILDALRQQFDSELYGECRVEGSRAYQQITCSYLDVQMLERSARSETLLYISNYANTHPVSELYDENNNYRPELMREGWEAAVPELLKNPRAFLSSSGVSDAQLNISLPPFSPTTQSSAPSARRNSRGSP